MELLPTSAATRPRLACEVRMGGVVAARSESASAEIAAVARSPLPGGAVVPSLRAGNIADPEALTGAIRQALDGVVSPRERGRYATLLLPAAAVRVLLIDFDSLPAKAAEALPVVRFRMRKLLPFDVDHALVSYQQMPSPAGSVSVLAAAIPRDVLLEYETAVTRAGYLPGAVLPSTLAVMAGWDDPAPALIVHTDAQTVTTAIVRAGAVLLHRTVEVGSDGEGSGRGSAGDVGDGLTVIRGGVGREGSIPGAASDYDVLDLAASMSEAAAVMHPDSLTLRAAPELAVASLNEAPPATRAREIAQAVSVAAAYFEDTLRVVPEEVFVAGTVSAAELEELLGEFGIETLQVREMVSDSAVAAVGSVEMPGRGILAGLRGALRG